MIASGPAALAVIYLIVLGFVYFRRSGRDSSETWLLGYCAYSVVLLVLHALVLMRKAEGSATGAIVTTMGMMFSISLLGFLTLAYLKQSGKALWSAFSIAWISMLLIAHLSNAPAVMGQRIRFLLLLEPEVKLSTEIVAIGWLLAAVMLIALTLYAFWMEQRPIYANRLFFWFFIVMAILPGELLSAWLTSFLSYVGYGLRLVGALGAAYAILAYRILDIRGVIRWVVSRSILTLVTGILAFLGILAVLFVPTPDELGEIGRWVLVLAAAVGVAVLQQPLRQLFRWLLRGLIIREVIDPTEAVQQYGQRISQVIELKELAKVAVEAINELLKTRRSYLILATYNEEGKQVALEVLGGEQSPEVAIGSLSFDSPLYKRFTTSPRPLLQYDIDYHRDYQDTPAVERRYFNALGTDIYTPILDEDKLSGLIALGPKINDDPFFASEMKLLMALAQQTVSGLKNARLFEEQRRLNQEKSALLEDLRRTNERLERLDAVKTDFITIASHELRTPLTQIQGYSDLLMEMAERNILDPSQAVEITRSLSKASGRMTEVINSMLDVSQIDIENMDLSFVETSVSNVIKLAVDPYDAAINERRLTLAARGLRNLPPIYADFKRLVQAFQNLISNAIKFTPDGGTINIVGQTYQSNTDGDPVSVQISISDTGIGIDPEYQELIFEKFYRVGSTSLHSTGSTKFKGAGPGLGLPIAKGIIEGHGGRIWVESEGYDEEKLPGTTVHVVLPIRPPAMDARQRLREIQRGTAGGSGASQDTDGKETPVGPSSSSDK